MVKDFDKRLDRRLSPNFLSLLVELMFSVDTTDADRRAGLNVFNLVIDRVGQNLTRAKNFFGQLVESYLTLPENQARFLQPLYAKLICAIHGVGQSQRLPHPALMAIYEAGYLKGDGEARVLAEKLYHLAVHHYIWLHPELPGSPPVPEVLSHGLISQPWLCHNHELAVAVYETLLADLDQAVDLSNETTAQITLIEANQQLVEDRLVKLWEEIISQPNYDVLDQGGDRLAITGWLNRIGIELLTFIREGFVFPSVGTRMVYRFFDRTFAALYPLDPQLSVNNSSAKNICALPIFILSTVCYHRIICAKPRLTDQTTGRQSLKPSKPTHLGTYSSQVRAHFRKLLPGWQPSPKQVQAAKTRLGYLKDGYTFVLPHERSAPAKSINLPTQLSMPVHQSRVSFEEIMTDLLKNI